ncbi:MAG: signal peptidase I [Anaerolineales bacterium]|nr:signal peptidase I [Anaerolineales bacterium]
MENFQSEIIPESGESVQQGSHWLRNILDIVETLVIALVLFAGINAISARIRVDGHSMEPTLHTGEFVIVYKLAYRFGSAKIGDVIVFHPPNNPTEEFIKRVIGLPGDHVVIKDEKVMVNGLVLEEQYIKAAPGYDVDVIVDENGLFVLGDNRNNSSDSHAWGAVPLENVIGKAVVIYWPPENWGLINHNEAVVAASQN